MTDAQYCAALSAKYRDYRTSQVDEAAAAAMAQCQAGNTAAGIPVLERADDGQDTASVALLTMAASGRLAKRPAAPAGPGPASRRHQEDRQHGERWSEQRGPSPHAKDVHVQIGHGEPAKHGDDDVYPSQR